MRLINFDSVACGACKSAHACMMRESMNQLDAHFKGGNGNLVLHEIRTDKSCSGEKCMMIYCMDKKKLDAVEEVLLLQCIQVVQHQLIRQERRARSRDATERCDWKSSPQSSQTLRAYQFGTGGKETERLRGRRGCEGS